MISGGIIVSMKFIIQVVVSQENPQRSSDSSQKRRTNLKKLNCNYGKWF